ncbi:VOC family protein [Methylobacterium sp. SyP6R]|uniref:VOC family protein n=1 Tax=Methylobacterium sp. SyP6R TaxID=2718876 RepID=UPI001F347DA5|nr:VOC family protein [Methylobacterium sp. SyP6R]MCF4129916.1 VOC family protein [Methylobacterium sp. SyP6R]
MVATPESPATPVSLISRWFIRPGREEEASAALARLAQAVRAQEPDTLTYLVHRPAGEARLQSLPPSEPNVVVFFESYRNAQAFLSHVNGPVFQDFVAGHGDLFVPTGGAHPVPFATVEFLRKEAGFVRAAGEPEADDDASAVNHFPSVMFEVVAEDLAAAKAFYAEVFGWHYQAGTSGFQYIHFPAGAPPLLGGLGQADSAVKGFEPGRNFYLLVPTIEPFLERALAAGGTSLMPPTRVDGYRFAMFRDPEGNPIGLIEPFEF